MILSCLTFWLTVARVALPLPSSWQWPWLFAQPSVCIWLTLIALCLFLRRSGQAFLLLWADDGQDPCILVLLCPRDQSVFRKDADQVLLLSALTSALMLLLISASVDVFSLTLADFEFPAESG